MKRQYGCDSDIAPYKFFGEKLTRCPLRMVLDDPGLLHDALYAYDWFERGFLPSPGTWPDQSVPFLQFTDAIKSAHSEADAVELKQMGEPKPPGP